MESYEDHPWCPYGYQSGEEEGHHHDPNLAKVRARSNSRSRHHRSSFLVDELDMLMDKAATTIQATWRGYLTRRRLLTEHAAATTIQAAWRGFITREYLALQRDHVPSWNMRGPKRPTPSPASSEDGRRSWGRPSMDKERAAEVIQAHYRGYLTRRAIAQCHEAATTIQAHWRGYHTRQELARGSGYPGRQVRMSGVPAEVGPYPRAHWEKVLVGDPEEWEAKVPTRSYEKRRREPTKPPQRKTCPQCGRCMSVRVLTGVGKGPPSESEMDESDYEERVRPCSPARPPSACSSSSRSPSACRRATQKSPGCGSERQNPTRNCPSGPHASYPTCSQSYYPTNCRTSACQPRRQGCSSGGMCPRYGPRPTRDCSASRSHSATSVRHQREPADGTADWLFENYCTRPMSEGQRRVFKTRKHVWQVVRAATLIQAFWRGCQARKELRQQQAAATKIQSAYRGYKTRAYLMEAGVLSEGDTD